jgi:predicted porin
MFKRTVLQMAILMTLALCQPVFADELSELRAEIAAQKNAAEAQRLRLEALEKKLEAVQSAQASQSTQVAANSSGAVSGVLGEGLTYKSPTTTVTLYGLLDVTASTINHADAKGARLTSYQTAWFSGNRWGITGKRKLNADGLNAIFRLESEYLYTTGEQDAAGVLFGRDAWAGFESAALGKITFGRQNALARDFAAIYLDPYGAAKNSTEEGGGTNTNNFKQLIFYAGSATGTRYDRGLVWKKVFEGGLTAGVGYQFGGVPGDFSRGSTKTLSLGYNIGALNVAGFVNDANVAGLSNKSYSIGGNYQLGDVRLNTGYFHYTAEQGALASRKDDAYTVSMKYTPTGPLDYQVGYQVMDAKNAAVNSGGNVLNAYANASTAKAVASGKRSTLYGSVFYHFDKLTEVYFAADYLKLSEGYKAAATNGFNSQIEFGLGMRTRF